MLADRVGIIDHGRIVAEGTPEALKAEIGRPSARGRARRSRRPRRRRRPCSRASASPLPARRRAPSPCGWSPARTARRASCARSTARASASPTCSCTRPRSTTSSSPRPGRKLDGRARRQPEPQARGGRCPSLLGAGRRDGAAIGAADAAPARDGRSRRSLFPLILLAVNVGGLEAATNLPGFPTDDYLNFAIAFPFIQGALFASINAGSSLARDVETGFLKRLALTPMRRGALLLGNLAGVMTVALIAARRLPRGRVRGRPALRRRRRRRRWC